MQIMRSGRKRTRGQALVEFGLVLPILVLVMVAILEMGFVVKDFIAVNYALTQVVKEASLMRGVRNADLQLVRFLLQSTYGLYPDRLTLVAPDGAAVGPYFLDGDDVTDASGAPVTGFGAPLFFWSDGGTPEDSSDDAAVLTSGNPAYVRITLQYRHDNLTPFTEFLAFDKLTITQTKVARVE